MVEKKKNRILKRSNRYRKQKYFHWFPSRDCRRRGIHLWENVGHISSLLLQWTVCVLDNLCSSWRVLSFMLFPLQFSGRSLLVESWLKSLVSISVSDSLYQSLSLSLFLWYPLQTCSCICGNQVRLYLVDSLVRCVLVYQ